MDGGRREGEEKKKGRKGRKDGREERQKKKRKRRTRNASRIPLPEKFVGFAFPSLCFLLPSFFQIICLSNKQITPPKKPRKARKYLWLQIKFFCSHMKH